MDVRKKIIGNQYQTQNPNSSGFIVIGAGKNLNSKNAHKGERRVRFEKLGYKNPNRGAPLILWQHQATL